MLDEFMTFNDKKMPDPNMILKPKQPKPIKNKEDSMGKIQRPKKQSIVNLEGIEELKQLEEETLKLMKEQEALSLAEQVLQRQQKEQDRKKKEILKQLHKAKYIDLNKFLTRTEGYEQKKNFDLEQKRFKKLEEESKLFKERPLLSQKTAEMCQTLYKKPIYKRTKEIIENRQKKLNELKNKDYKYNKKLRNKNNKSKNKKENRSMDKIIISEEKLRKRKEYIINEKTKNKKMNNREMEDYYNRQYEWKNKLEEKNKLKEKNKKKKKDNEYVNYFHPHLSQGTIEIINAKNEINDNYNWYQQTPHNNPNNDIVYPHLMSFRKNVYDRLYEDNTLYDMKKNENKNKNMCTFQPFTNKNKYKEVKSKYNEINKKKRKKRTRNNKNNLKAARSVEANSKKEEIEINKDKKNKMNSSFDNIKKKKGKKSNEPLINVLFKLKNNDNQFDDISYRLNVRQGSAWNENVVNTVPYRGESREIVKYFL